MNEEDKALLIAWHKKRFDTLVASIGLLPEDPSMVPHMILDAVALIKQQEWTDVNFKAKQYDKMTKDADLW